MRISNNIFELSVGSVGIVAGYSRAYGGYIGSLISKGLIPGTDFVVLDLASDRGTVQIMLEEKIVILSKPEVNALCIDGVEEEF